MALLSLKDISFGFGGFPLLDHIDLQIEPGDRAFLLGRNGSGKTTLMKLINGDSQADSGEIARAQGLTTALLDQEIPGGISGPVIDIVTAGLGPKRQLLLDFHRTTAQLAEKTGSQPQLLDRLDRLGRQLDTENGWEIHRRVDQVIARMDLPAESEFTALSTGLKRRTLLARALVSSPDILLLDEPTNHLDIDAITWLETFLAEYRGAVLIVTHDRLLVRKLANRIIEIDRGHLLDCRCDYPTFLERREQELFAEENQNRQFDKKLSIEETWIRQGIKARRRRNEGRVKALMRMREQRRQRQERSGSVNMVLQGAKRSGSLVIEASAVSFAFGENQVIRNFSTVIMRGDRVGIIGPNGCGKTTLLRLLLGDLPPVGGSVRLGTNLETIYFDQLRDQLDDEKSVFDNVAQGSDRVLINGQNQHVIGYLQKFLFPPERARMKVKYLSGGERCRLLLARLFTRPANLLVLDEPTNDLDIETLEFLEELLLDFSGTLLLVSHDRTFLDNVVTSTLVFEGNGKIGEYVGGFSDWRRLAREDPPPQPEKEIKPAVVKTRAPSLKLSFREEKELSGLPGRIDDLEAEKKRLLQSLADPRFYQTAGSDIGIVNQRLQALEKELADAYQRWELLEEQKNRAAVKKAT